MDYKTRTFVSNYETYRLRSYNLIENNLYVCWYFYNRKTLCKFIKSTEKGYNFIDINSGKFYLKRHLYSKDKKNFIVSNNLYISDDLKYNGFTNEFNLINRKNKIKNLLNKIKRLIN